MHLRGIHVYMGMGLTRGFEPEGKDGAYPRRADNKEGNSQDMIIQRGYGLVPWTLGQRLSWRNLDRKTQNTKDAHT